MNLFVLTGAGVSAESGLGIFREPGAALWKRFDPMQLATPEAFARDPALVHAFYNARGATCSTPPNAAHAALAQLEAVLARRAARSFSAPRTSTTCTSAPARRASSTCMANCSSALRLMRRRPRLPRRPFHRRRVCGRAGALRPDVVWFGEMPLWMDEIDAALAAADRFVAIGTSGAVYPAAGFVARRAPAVCACCELNLAPSDNADRFDDRRYGRASEITPSWVQEILAR